MKSIFIGNNRKNIGFQIQRPRLDKQLIHMFITLELIEQELALETLILNKVFMFR